MPNYETYPLKLYSRLIESVEQFNLKVAPVNQWRATLLNAKGVQKDELAFAGVNEMLSSANAMMTKEDLILKLKGNIASCMPTLKLEKMGGYNPSLLYQRLPLDKIPVKIFDSFRGEDIQAYVMPSFNYRIVGVNYKDIFGSTKRWFVFDNQWKEIKLPLDKSVYLTGTEALDKIYSLIKDKFIAHESNSTSIHYEQYSILGGRNYQEWLLSLDDYKSSYYSSHFDVHNLLLHIRTSEWIDAEGKHLLLIDEIQSDWHNQLRFEETDQIPYAPYAKEWPTLGVKVACMIAINKDISCIGFSAGYHHRERYGIDSDGFYTLYDKIIPTILSKMNSKFKCDVSFKTLKIKSPKAKLSYQSSGWNVKADNSSIFKNPIRNKKVALEFLKNSGKTNLDRVRTINLNSETIKLIKDKGLPIFGW